jgi:hypothetical protein
MAKKKKKAEEITKDVFLSIFNHELLEYPYIIGNITERLDIADFKCYKHNKVAFKAQYDIPIEGDKGRVKTTWEGERFKLDKIGEKFDVMLSPFASLKNLCLSGVKYVDKFKDLYQVLTLGINDLSEELCIADKCTEKFKEIISSLMKEAPAKGAWNGVFDSKLCVALNNGSEGKAKSTLMALRKKFIAIKDEYLQELRDNFITEQVEAIRRNIEQGVEDFAKAKCNQEIEKFLGALGDENTQSRFDALWDDE